jgi:hypothetical protein
MRSRGIKAKPNNTAYAIALTLGLLLAYVGARALSGFYAPPPAFQSDHQQLMFNAVDVVLSAALLASGANGIHSVVSSITMFFDSNAQKEEELRQGCMMGVAGEVMLQCARTPASVAPMCPGPNTSALLTCHPAGDLETASSRNQP